MIKEASGDRVGTGMSFFMVGGESARTLGPLIVTAAVSLWGLEGIYKLMPLGIVASIVLYIKLKDFDTNRPIQKPKEKGDTKKLLSTSLSCKPRRNSLVCWYIYLYTSTFWCYWNTYLRKYLRQDRKKNYTCYSEYWFCHKHGTLYMV